MAGTGTARRTIWVRVCQLRLPIPLRLLLAAQPKLAALVLQVVHRAITRFLRQQELVTLIQRMGSAANLNIHRNCLVLDGLYEKGVWVHSRCRAAP